jgi:hypothetical protein
MRVATFESSLPSGPIDSLPATLFQTSSRLSPLLMLVLALPASFAALSPFVLIARQVALDASPFLARQDTSALLFLALVVWTALFCWPVLRLAGTIGRTREIVLWHQCVSVTDQSLSGRRVWSEPLSSYRGLAHFVRSSHSGTRHELVLVHDNAAHSLVLRTADRIGQAEIDALTQLLGCREIAPQVFYPTPVRYKVVPQTVPQRELVVAGLASVEA